MALAMLPTKSLQHCQDQMIRANVAKQKSAALPRADDSGHCVDSLASKKEHVKSSVTRIRMSREVK